MCLYLHWGSRPSSLCELVSISDAYCRLEQTQSVETQYSTKG